MTVKVLVSFTGKIMLFYVKFLQDKGNTPKDEQKYQLIFLLSFSESRVSSVSGSGNTQKLNCRRQVLDSTHFTVSLVPAW